MLQATTTLSAARPRALMIWLLAVAALVLVMVLVGGITRLTESGLSITEWRPVTGTLPPLSEAAWAEEFAKYKQIPEYTEINAGMSLAAFKAIYFWEYVHRLLGRLIGLAFALPLLWFAVRRAIPRGYGARLVALLLLGGAQGAIGWWMVASGLSERTDVSHVRLALHLLTALVILGGLIWTALDLRELAATGRARAARVRPVAWLAFALLFAQLLLGAFTAGLNAGYAFDTWPLMGDALFPAGTPLLEPHWRNLIDNPVTVQFVHRWWAFVAAAGVLALAGATARAGGVMLAGALVLLLVAQIALGIATLLSGVAIAVAVAHQGMAALLVMLTVAAAHRIGRG